MRDSLTAEGTYVTVGGELSRLLPVAVAGLGMKMATRRRMQVITLRPNRDLAQLGAAFEAGHLTPVIDGPYPLSDGREAFRRFGSGLHEGKIVITITE